MATAAEMDIIIGAQVSGAVNGLKQVNTQLTKTEQTAARVSKKAGSDFTNLSRIIQDLPFGFTAISNNLTQILPAAGAAGLAISALVAAVTFAQVGFSAWTRGMGKSKEELDELSKAGAGVATEVTKMSALLAVARDVNESTGARSESIKELNRLYPGHLANLTLENVNSQETAHAVDLLSEALARKAKVQALSNLLTAANEKLIKAENATVQENLLSVKAFLGLFKGGALGAGGVAGAFGGASEALASNIGDAKTEVAGLNAQLTALTQEQARNKDFSLLNPTTPKKLKEVAEGFQHINANIKGIKPKFISAIAVETGDNINKTIQKELDKNPLLVTIEPPPVEEMNDISKLLTAMLNDSLATVGEAIGNIVSGMNNPFSSFFSIIGEGLKAIGKQLIELGGLAVIIQNALKQIFKTPALAIAAGIAAIALGTIISNKAKNIKGFATGGVVTSPTLAMVGEAGPERITPLGYEGRMNNNNWGGQVEFVISGQVLRGILKRADNVAFNTF